MLGHQESVFQAPWPQFEDRFLQEDAIEYPIQVNGKLRSRITVSAGATDEAIRQAALADPKTQEWLKGTVTKVIVVPKKLVSIVVA